jgi:hypothetical protein
MNMKRIGLLLATIVVVVGVGFGIYKTSHTLKGGVNVNASNFLNFVSQTTTSTNATLPVLVLARNYSRQWARISNVNCTNPVYLFWNNFDSGIAASGTVNVSTSTQGYPLLVSSTLTIDPTNLYPGDIWAATSTIACKLFVTFQ